MLRCSNRFNRSVLPRDNTQGHAGS